MSVPKYFTKPENPEISALWNWQIINGE